MVGFCITITIIQIHVSNFKEIKIRVACIGDSITENTNYPIELQNKLGNEYVVRNFGISGSTILFDTYLPYIFQTEFIRAKAFLPHIVIIMLGTNDARTDNFKSIENFKENFIELINEIQSIQTNPHIQTKPQIFIAKPPPLFENELYLEITSFSEGIIPRIEEIAEQMDLPIIDIYSELIDYPEYFPDGVHPNNKGGEEIALEVYMAIIKLDKYS